MTEHNSHGQYFSIIPHWIIFSGISSGAIHLYAVIAKYADYDTHEAFPSRTTLAKGIGKSPDTVDRHVKELQAIGALNVTKRKLPGTQGNQTNIYELVYEKPSEVAALVRPGGEDDDDLAAPMPPGVAAPVSHPSRKDAAQNDTHLTKPTLNKNPSLKEVPLSSAGRLFVVPDENEGDEDSTDDAKERAIDAAFAALGRKRKKAS